MQRKPLFFLLAFSVMFVISCKSKDKTGGLPIPNDASLVLHLNTKSLASKLTWNEIKQTNWFKQMQSEADDSLAQKIMNDPATSGVNVEEDLVYFMRNLKKGGGYMVLEGTLKDAAAFEAANKKATEGQTSKVGELNVIKSKDEFVVTWKDNRFIYVINAPFLDMDYSKRYRQYDSTGASSSSDGLTADSLVKYAQELYDLKSDKSLGSDKRFSSLIQESGDVHLWMNAHNLYGSMISGMLSMMKFSTLLEGNIATATLNFDNGKITMDSKNYYNEEFGKLIKKYPAKNVDADALKRIPSDSVVAVFSMNYPPEGLKEFLKVLGVDGFINGFLGKADYSIDEFVKANKGDLLFAVSDFKIKNETVTIPGYDGGEPYTYNKTEPEAKYLFAVAVNDKPAFDKMISVVQKQVGSEFGQNGPKISFGINDKWFAIGNNEEQVNKFQAGGHSNKQAFISKLSGHPVVGYVDINSMIKASEATATDSTSKIVFSESLKMWQDGYLTGGIVKDGAATSHFEINLVDKSTNSLKQLNQYADKLSALKKKGF